MIRTNSQKHERQRKEEEQGTKANRFSDRTDTMRHKGTLSEWLRIKGARVKNKAHKNKNVTIIQAMR